MLDFPFQAQLAIAIAERPSKLRFQPSKVLDLLAHICQLAFEHRLNFGAIVMFLAQRQQFLHFGQREPQLLGMADKLEFMNLISIEQAIAAGAPARTLNESNFLVEPDRVHTDTGLLRSFSDLNSFSHITIKDKPWSYVQSQAESDAATCGLAWVKTSGEHFRSRGGDYARTDLTRI